MGLHTPWQKLGRSVTKMLDHNNFLEYPDQKNQKK